MARPPIRSLARPHFSLALVLVMFACSRLAIAQQLNDAPTANDTKTKTKTQASYDKPLTQSTSPQQVLKGPHVEDPPRMSLVEYVYGGSLRELDLPAGEAALELLDLDESVADKVAHVLAQRAQLAEQLIIDNFDFVSQGETIEAADNKLAKGLFFVRALMIFEPLIERGRIENEVVKVLPPQQAKQYTTILDEYWDAYARAELEKNHQRITRRAINRLIRKARNDEFGKEIELAADRAINSEEFAVGYLLRDMHLTAEQEQRIHKLLIDYITTSMGQPSEEATDKLFLSVIMFLNEDQRQLLAKRIKGL